MCIRDRYPTLERATESAMGRGYRAVRVRLPGAELRARTDGGAGDEGRSEQSNNPVSCCILSAMHSRTLLSIAVAVFFMAALAGDPAAQQAPQSQPQAQGQNPQAQQAPAPNPNSVQVGVPNGRGGAPARGRGAAASVGTVSYTH